VIKNLINQFKSGNIPQPLAYIILNKNKSDLPMWRWSINNIMSCVLAGATDARGYRQWKKVGRYPTTKANMFILVPLFYTKKNDDGEEEQIHYGFKTTPVWDIT
ncbi:MAG: hypothetical protein CUN57_03890, partial [Phototrophicales bacterium]